MIKNLKNYKRREIIKILRCINSYSFYTKYLQYFFCKRLFIILLLLFSSCRFLSHKKIVDQNFKKAQREEKTATIVSNKNNVVYENLNQKIKKQDLTTKEIAVLHTLLKKSHSNQFKNKIRMLLGQSYLKKNNLKAALKSYKKIQLYPLRGYALLETAMIYYKKKQYSQSVSQINKLLDEKQYSAILLMNALRLKEKLMIKTQPQNYIELLKIYGNILKNSIEKKDLYRKKAYKLILKMTVKDLIKIAKKDFITSVKDLIFFRIGKSLFDQQKFNKSYYFFKKQLKFSTQIKLEKRALKYIQAIQSRKKVNKKYIGVILPLTGRSANIGKRSLQGIQMGFDMYSKRSNSFKLIIMNNNGDSGKARRAVEKLVLYHHVIGIIGGVLSKTAGAIAEEAQNFGIPTIVLSQKTGLTQAGEYVFQNGLNSKIVVDQLTDFLINKLQLKRFAILYPNDTYGVDYTNEFWTSVEKKGGKISGVQVYKPKETNFNGPIRRLTGNYYKQDRIEEYKEKLKNWFLQQPSLSKRRKSPPENLLSPIINFEVLFIPDSIKALNLIAPHLAYNDIKHLYLVGTTLWNEHPLIKKHSKYIDKIFFMNTNLSNKTFKDSNFFKQFLNTFGQAPGLFEVQAYEAALAFHQTIAGGARNRNDLRTNLAQLNIFHGPISNIKINANREFNRPLAIFKIEDQKVFPVQ